MKLNFNEDKKNVKAELIESDFEGLLKAQKEVIPQVQKGVQEAFKNYSGTMVAVIIIHEDENGNPEGRTEYISGVGTLKSQLALHKAFKTAQTSVIEAVAKGMASNPDVGIESITELVDEMKSSLKKGKK